MNPLARLLVLLSPFAAGCGPEPAPAPPPYEGVPVTPPLGVGAALPPLRAAGWLNGPPPAPGQAGVRLLVVDVWALWCPFCSRNAPGLSDVFEKYKSRGVAFVSLTNQDETGAKGYVRGQSAPWPSGYGIDRDMIIALGVGSGMMTRGYEIAPTVYLVDPTGRVVWTDDRGRHRHVDAATWAADLDAAVADHLPP